MCVLLQAQFVDTSIVQTDMLERNKQRSRYIQAHSLLCSYLCSFRRDVCHAHQLIQKSFVRCSRKGNLDGKIDDSLYDNCPEPDYGSGPVYFRCLCAKCNAGSSGRISINCYRDTSNTFAYGHPADEYAATCRYTRPACEVHPPRYFHTCVLLPPRICLPSCEIRPHMYLPPLFRIRPCTHARNSCSSVYALIADCTGTTETTIATV